jgi:hypothetical protein
MSASSDTSSKPQLELNVEQNEEGQVAATCFIRWCQPNGALIQEITARKFVNPMLILAIYAPRLDSIGNRRFESLSMTSLVVSPLTQEMTHVNFQRPGKNTIRGLIIDVSTDSDYKLLKSIKKGDFSFFSDENEISRHVWRSGLKYIELDSEIDVEVPVEMFAKEPSQFRKKLVKRFFKGKEVDQCHLRARTIASCVAASLLLTIGQIIKFSFTMIATVLGVRSIRYKELLHPWRRGIFGPIEYLDKKGSFWFSDEYGGFRVTPLLVLNPIVLTVPAFIVWAVVSLNVQNHNTIKHVVHKLPYPPYWHYLWVIDRWIVATAIIGTVCGVVLVGGLALYAHFFDTAEKRQARANKKDTARRAKENQIASDLASMTCKSTPSVATLGALPREKRTVALRFADLKIRVCKPYAQ